MNEGTDFAATIAETRARERLFPEFSHSTAHCGPPSRAQPVAFALGNRARVGFCRSGEAGLGAPAVMERRDFLNLVVGWATLDTVLRQGLLAQSARAEVQQWLQEVSQLCRDLKMERLRPRQWQEHIDRLHRRLGVADLLNLVDFDNQVRHFHYPDLGVITADPALPRLQGAERYPFVARIFGMQRDRAIIPHGHKNMVSCHRVLKGEFELRQYDRLEDRADALLIRQTVEEKATVGSFSSISEEKDNVHWLIARSPRAFTFDILVTDLLGLEAEIDNIDIAAARKVGADLLLAPKIDVDRALRKYGKSHH